jgi:hypothetical protein
VRATRPRLAPWSSAPPDTRCCCTCPVWLWPRAGPRRADRQDPDSPGGIAPVADLGPGSGDGPVETGGHRCGDRPLLLRPARTLAARIQRKHQRPCCASTFPRAPISGSMGKPNSTPWPLNSTTGPASGLAMPNRSSSSLTCSQANYPAPEYPLAILADEQKHKPR